MAKTLQLIRVSHLPLDKAIELAMDLVIDGEVKGDHFNIYQYDNHLLCEPEPRASFIYWRIFYLQSIDHRIWSFCLTRKEGERKD